MANPVRDLENRVDLIVQAWGTTCPEKTFSGLTLDQFKEAVKASREVRAALKELAGRTQAVQKERKLVDAETHTMVRRVVFAVKGDPQEGENGKLYAAMGFVPHSQRARPTRRRRKEVEATES
jgi:hypothetical protein